MIISNNAENFTHFHGKNTGQMKNKRGTFKTIQGICEKLTDNIVFSGERLKAFFLRSRTRQGSSCYFFFKVITVLVRAFR